MPLKLKIKTPAQVAAEIARRKRIWKSLTPQKRRVAVAKDVLEQIKLDRIVPNTGAWVCGLNTYEGSFQKTMLAGTNSCNACALGSMMVSLTLFKNRVKSADATDKLDYLNIKEHSGKDVSGITKLFSNEQLEMIETAFELGDGYHNQIYGENISEETRDRCIDFGSAHSHEHNRLVAIMKNIVANKGEFVP